jgi:hypothetical protein
MNPINVAAIHVAYLFFNAWNIGMEINGLKKYHRY